MPVFPATPSSFVTYYTCIVDLLRRIMIDAENFDTRVWIVAVSIVMGSLLILSLGTCLVLYKECRDSTGIEIESF